MRILVGSIGVTCVSFAAILLLTDEPLVLIPGAVILAVPIFLYLVQRRSHEKNFERVTDMVNDLIARRALDKDIAVSENSDKMLSKLQHQLVRLNGITANYSEQAERDRDEIRKLIVEIAHQLRMPITNIETYLDLLKDDKLGLEEKNKYIGAIEESEKKLAFLIESFIKMSRLENKIIQIKKESFDINTTIRKSIDQTSAPDTIDFSTQFDRDVPHDSNWLGEAIFNLLDNAIKYSEDGAPISIEVDDIGAFAQIAIKDRGMGIPKGEEHDIFKRFYRGGNVTTQEGFGLGLHITREIVVAHGGFVRTKRGDNGTTFLIYIPI